MTRCSSCSGLCASKKTSEARYCSQQNALVKSGAHMLNDHRHASLTCLPTMQPSRSPLARLRASASAAAQACALCGCGVALASAQGVTGLMHDQSVRLISPPNTASESPACTLPLAAPTCQARFQKPHAAEHCLTAWIHPAVQGSKSIWFCAVGVTLSELQTCLWRAA